MPTGRPNNEQVTAATATASTNWIFELPAQLEADIPLCANVCLSSYITQAFTCPANSLTCLCSNYSTDGYTLGELAFLCLSLDCPSSTTDQAIDAYNACASVPSAVQPVHSTLTLPASTPTTSRKATSSTSLPQTISVSLSTSIPSASVSATASKSGVSIIPSVPSSTHSPTPTAGAAALASSKGSTGLTTAQAVGVAIAAMGAVMVALGVFYAFVCIKRRKARKAKEGRHSYEFIDDAPARVSPSNKISTKSEQPLDGFVGSGAGLPYEKRGTQWLGRRSQNGSGQAIGCAGPNHNGKSLIRNPETQRPISPESVHSNSSMRTTSQLLPDRPGSVLLQRNQGHGTPDTVFEEERATRVRLPGLPAHPAVLKQRQPQHTIHYTRSPDALKQPPLSLEIPRTASGSGSLGSLGAFPLPPPPAVRPLEDSHRSSGHSKSRSSNNSVLNYYASPECASRSSPDDLYSSTPIEEGSQIRRPPPTTISVTKPTYPPKAVRMSTASDTSRRTSFESTDPDEPTPPEEEEKQLTPVAEVESPISGIRYPKVPRSSNQSVPRSPNYMGSPRLGIGTDFELASVPNKMLVTPEQQKPAKHSPSLSLSGSTLAAKRRGDGVAQDLEKGLRITGSSHSRNNSQSQLSKASQVPRHSQRNESPLRGYGRVANSTKREPEWPLVSSKQEMQSSQRPDAPLKSPLWEPKLTPRKEGDDLYLSVSAATPRRMQFHVR